MAKEWHYRDTLYELYDEINDSKDDKYKCPSFTDDIKLFVTDEYFKDRGFKPTTKFGYWEWDDGDPKWTPMPDHITDLEEAKAYALIMWRMQ